MIDVKHPIRKAFFECLNGNLSYSGQNVVVGDDTVDSDADAFVILGNQTGYDASSFQSFDSWETIDVDIVGKAGIFANKNAVDFIASQILNLVLPTFAGSGLPEQIGVQINCISVNADRDMPSIFNAADSVVRRIITFKMRVRQTAGSDAMPLTPSGEIAWIPNETPSGTIDGSNKVFTTAYDYVPSKLNVFINGLLQTPGLHYTMQPPRQITFTDAPRIDPDDGEDNINTEYLRKF